MSIKEYKLGDICTLFSGTTPRRSKPDFWKNPNTNWFTSSEISGNMITSKEKINNDKIRMKLIPKNTTLIAMYGVTAGKVGFLNSDSTINQAICAILESSKIRSKYIYYNLIKKNKFIKSLASGSAQQNLSVKKISEFKILVPEIQIQQQIIDIIEPFEKFKQNTNRILSMISNLMDLINLYVKPIGLMKDFKVIFEKGKNIPSDLITTSETKIPFINVSAINNNINKYIIENDIFHKNITYGDVVLSLDGTIGLVNNFISGINGYGYKVYSDTIHESTIYYSLLNSINLDIISKCSKGSVIKHASSSKDKLLIFDYKEVNIKAIYSLEIMLKKKLLLIDKIIKYSIEKYVL